MHVEILTLAEWSNISVLSVEVHMRTPIIRQRSWKEMIFVTKEYVAIVLKTNPPSTKGTQRTPKWTFYYHSQYIANLTVSQLHIKFHVFLMKFTIGPKFLAPGPRGRVRWTEKNITSISHINCVHISCPYGAPPRKFNPWVNISPRIISHSPLKIGT